MTDGRSRGRSAVVAVVTLLVVLFPALRAGAGIDGPVSDGEVARLGAAAAAAGTDAAASPATLFYGLLLPDGVAADDEQRLRDLVPRCRLASVIGMFAISGLLYLTVVLARGRTRALLACIALGCLPPVAIDGAILRAEIPTAAFAALGVLVLCGLPVRLRHARREPALRRWLAISLITIAAGTAFALSIASLTAYGVYLLVPAGCLAWALGLHGMSLHRALRRVHVLMLPIRAFTARMLPWLLAALFPLLITTTILSLVRSETGPTPATVSVLPAAPWLALPVVALALLGGALWALKVGLQTGHRRRLSASAVLLVWALALTVHRAAIAEDGDGLPAAIALAVFLGEGARAALGFSAARLLAR